MALRDDAATRFEGSAGATAQRRSSGPRFLILDGLRFVFALIVMIGHLTGKFEQSYLAVDFFFILSGFVLTWVYWERAHEPEIFRTSVIDRVARLYPLHLATLLFLAIIELCDWATGNGDPGDPGHHVGFLLNLILLQAIGPAVELPKALGLGPEQLNPWNGPAWSVSVEMYGNLLLAATLIAFATTWLRLAWIIVIAGAGSYALLATTCLNLTCEDFINNSPFAPAVHGIGCRLLRGLGAMALGVLCCGAVRHLRHKQWCVAISAPIALPGGAALLALVLLDQPVYGDIAAIAAASVVVSSVALYEHRKPLKPMPRLSTALLVAGALSYAVYLIHTPLIILTKRVLSGWIEQGPLPAAVLALLVVVIAFPVYYFFELPMKQATRKWLSQLFLRQPPSSRRSRSMRPV